MNTFFSRFRWRNVLARAASLTLALTLAFSAALLVAPKTSHAAVVTNTSTPVSGFAAVISCPSGPVGVDLFQLSGSLHFLSTVTFDGNGGYHTVIHVNEQGVSGVDIMTGDVYTVINTSHNVDNVGTVGSTFTALDIVVLIDQTTGNKLYVHQTSHITVNADGTVTAFVDNLTVTCS